VFSILGRGIVGTRVLDLFAGTGALGIEALSRGAESTVFVEKSASAISVISRNILLCGIGSQADVIRWDAARNLNCIRHADPKFNLVFMDPPYELGLIEPAVRHLISAGALEHNARIVIEHSVHESVPGHIENITLSDQRKYGKSLVSFFCCDMSSQTGG
jgi:16S rRNA (guanine(966)-N(2))-methyltransferase RsmD